MIHNNKRNLPYPQTNAPDGEGTRAKMSGPHDHRADRASLEEQIDSNLRRVYQSTLDDPIPDRFLSLISELRSKLSDRSAAQPTHVQEAAPE
jgi:hypothetical protein